MLHGLNEEFAFPILLPRPRISKRGPFYSSVTGKRVLVTGAGGSIGSELVIQIAGAKPSHLVMADISELNLYEIDLTLANGAPDQSKLAAICDVRDTKAVEKLFRDERPDVVFHAAALKHVPLLENDHNFVEAVLTNLVGTMNVANACAYYGAEMVLISTDKAVYPTSTMGQTKRLAELYVQALANEEESNRFLQVRFGNVIGSSGSVVPLFRRQIAQGGPVTVTHPEMTRYMMSIKQAVGLVLNASALHHEEGEGFGLYILDMGEPIKIIELAEQLIRLSGLQPYDDIEIQFIGMRPGEKLHEELVYPWEKLHETRVKGVRSAMPEYEVGLTLFPLLRELAELRDAARLKVHMRELLDGQEANVLA